jgi:Fanconi anemia group M protein
MGKTLIAFLLMGERLKSGRVAFLAPTRPLVAQHQKSFLELTETPEESTALITGEISPKKRKELWARQVCFSTPQSLKNDLLAKRADAGFSLVIIDEAHRAVGNYAYTFVAEKCAETGALLLGLTASPGGSRKRIQEIVDALCIQNIEIRTAEDADVAPYMKRLDISYVHVPLGESFTEARNLLSEMLSDYSDSLSAFGMHVPFRSKKALVELRMKIMRLSEKHRYAALSLYSSIFNVAHMLELIETQGPLPFLSYVEKMAARPDTKARHRVFADQRFITALDICKSAPMHPKLERLISILRERKGQKILVFAQYRDSVQSIVSALRQSGFSSERFVGKKDGVKADEQKATISRFSKGEFDVMVATSIGEEGLDIPSVDTVVFFEPIPSEIRSIQRRGRAGRLKAGSVIVLMATGTRDEGHFHSSKKKEENMRRIVFRMQRQFSPASRADDMKHASKAVIAQDEKGHGGRMHLDPMIPKYKSKPENSPPGALLGDSDVLIKKGKQSKITDF